MATMQQLNIAACAVIFLWATWCVVCPCVRDGISGKLILIVVAFSALGAMCGHISVEQTDGHRMAALLLNVSMALMGVRHAAMKYLWPRMVRAMRCAECPVNQKV